MADEPKKETVRIVLPPRRDGQPLASNPRETAMINLPPKPVPKPPGVAGAPASVPPPSASGVPTPPKPPGVPPSAGPKPPGAPVLPPRPPGAPASVAAPVKPVTPVAPIAPVAPASAPAASIARPPSVAGVAPATAPAPLTAESKKETAKVQVNPGSKSGVPQATVQLQKKPPVSASTSKSVSTGAAITVAPVANAAPAEELSVGLGGAALGIAILALAIQLWAML